MSAQNPAEAMREMCKALGGNQPIPTTRIPTPHTSGYHSPAFDTELSELRSNALHDAAMAADMDLGKFDDNDNDQAERIVNIAKRFERYLVTGE